MSHFSNWPVLTTYQNEHLRRVAMPLGGIGTGTVSLGGRGDLRDFEIVNRAAKGFALHQTFFAIRAATQNGPIFARALEGPISPHDYEGATGCAVINHGLPHFGSATFEAAYPLGQVTLDDPAAPVSVRLQAFNPLVPGDAEASGFPVAVLRYAVTNTTGETLSVSLAGSMENFIGRDATGGKIGRNRNEFRERNGVAGIFASSDDVPRDARQFGTLALGVLAAQGHLSHRTAWAHKGWGGALIDFWDDFSDDGTLEQPRRVNDEPENRGPVFSLCAQIELAPHETKSVTFILAWHFPNRLTWTPDENPAGVWGEGGACAVGPPIIGNYYTTQFADAWDVLEKFAPRLPDLESQTVAFVRAFCQSDLPHAVKEAALYNASTLRTQTTFRTPDGKLFGWEGTMDNDGSCYGSCTHVWNYEQATAFLFGNLSRSMRDVEFLHATSEAGLMSFRVGLPLESHAQHWKIAAADGQMGCLMKLYRDWKLSGDDGWLKTLWPSAVRVLAFCWIEGGWDADRDGVMEGCQHNTMDVEYYGPNPQMQGWYLGALRAMEEMARHLGERSQADEYRALFQSGSRWMDENLWNGEYYEHHIAPQNAGQIAPGLRHESVRRNDLENPKLQLGAGCLVDQLAGQFFAHAAGLGYLHDVAKVEQTLQSIYRYNFKEDFYDHFNPMRSFALGGESAVVMATYPRGNRPDEPFPYYNEAMTGFEYTAAIGMLQQGQTASGLNIIEAIRARYDGRKRSPFDEAECGHHYARAMASWAGIIALTGFEYSAVSQSLKFAVAAQNTRWFWSNGSAWGTFEQAPRDDAIAVTLRVGGGVLHLRTLELRGAGAIEFDVQAIRAGIRFDCAISTLSKAMRAGI